MLKVSSCIIVESALLVCCHGPCHLVSRCLPVVTLQSGVVPLVIFPPMSWVLSPPLTERLAHCIYFQLVGQQTTLEHVSIIYIKYGVQILDDLVAGRKRSLSIHNFQAA